MRRYFVYILASKSRRLYVGVTNDLIRRTFQHKRHEMPGFTAHYRIDRLVHFEETDYIHAALEREKEIKAWRRAKKVALIEQSNPTWEGLSAGWYDCPDG